MSVSLLLKGAGDERSVPAILPSHANGMVNMITEDQFYFNIQINISIFMSKICCITKCISNLALIYYV